METVEARVEKMEADLRRWGAKLDQLMAKADAAGTGARIDDRRRLDDMKTKYATAQTRLDELKFAGTSRWDAFKGGIEKAWMDLEAAFLKLAN